jgi:GTP-binding protein
MSIQSATFIKSVVSDDPVLDDGKPQVAFIGRSNVGKSSVINTLTGKKDLAHTSSMPGRTQQLNVFLINKKIYLIDLPGYGFAKASHMDREKLQHLIFWYLLESSYEQKKVVLVIDANIGITDTDMEMLVQLEQRKKNIIIVANKIDKLNKSDRNRCSQKIHNRVGDHKIILYSAEKKIGVGELSQEILK